MIRILVGLVLISCFILCHAQNKTEPIKVIFDTDMGPDYDDAGALAVLHALADLGEVEILATLASNKYKYTVPCIEIINTYFQKKYIPLGAPGKNGIICTDDVNPRWTDSLVVKYAHRNKTNEDAPDAVKTFRSVLSVQPDTSIVIITVGPLTNIADLLRSSADKISKSSGIELVRQKVKRIVCMAGCFPTGREYNIYTDPAASIIVTTQCPVLVSFCGFETGYPVLTGKRLIHSEISNNPVKDAYSIRMKYGDFDGRSSWDQLTVLAGVRIPEPYFTTIKGTIYVMPDGTNTWENNLEGKHEYFIRKMPVEELATIIEELMMHQPNK